MVTNAGFGLIILRPLDNILERYGEQLTSLSYANGVKVLARALNYEGKKAFSEVKRALRAQTSIPYATIGKHTKFIKASTSVGSSLSISIDARGPYIPLAEFKPKQLKSGASAVVWGRRQKFKSAFGAPGGPPKNVAVLKGSPRRRVGKSRLPIHTLYGPNVAVELIKDESKAAFQRAEPRLVERVEKEIAAVMRGY